MKQGGFFGLSGTGREGDNQMEVRHNVHPEDGKHYTTEQLRKNFLIQNLFQPNRCYMVYSHVDRMITGGVVPVQEQALQAGTGMGVDYFLQRREIGLINVGQAGYVDVDGNRYFLERTDGLYIGLGSKQVTFGSVNPEQPAKYYFNSAPAHASYPTVKIEKSRITGNPLGQIAHSNDRTIYKYIHSQGVQSCQLVMGMTVLSNGNMWNSMPCHTHDRRMEVYFYFDLPPDDLIFHFMGEPAETRHLILRNEEAVISPSWSIHSGVGTHRYSFIWGMAGENQVFDDMDGVSMQQLR
jgi:4-deoxy-L-threo-5-hexosulose-uronate ketol-isomerase